MGRAWVAVASTVLRMFVTPRNYRALSRVTVGLVSLTLTAVVGVGISTWLLQGVTIPSTSMAPTLLPGDKVIVVAADTRLDGIQRGEVVVFKDPGGWLDPTKHQTNPEAGFGQVLEQAGLTPSAGEEALIKRVVGLPGDRVSCCDRDGLIQVNTVSLIEPYVDGETDQVAFSVQVPEDSVFVLGDNRGDSEDSRFHLDVNNGAVPKAKVVGRAVAVVQPWRRATWLILPSTFDPVIDAGAERTLK